MITTEQFDQMALKVLMDENCDIYQAYANNAATIKKSRLIKAAIKRAYTSDSRLASVNPLVIAELCRVFLLLGAIMHEANICEKENNDE